MKNIIRGTLFLLFISISSITYAQVRANSPSPVKPESITNNELKSFLNASKDIKQVQQHSVQKIQKSLSKHGMSFQRFRQIMLSKQHPQTDTLKLGNKEKKKFQDIKADLSSIQSDAQKQMVSKIKNNGLKVDRYQQIYVTLQKSKTLQKRAKTLAKANQHNR